MGCLKVQYLITEKYKNILKSINYEQIILKIMNDSRTIFPSEYKHIKDQSNGESDFQDIEGLNYFDAKILFENEICQAIAKNEIYEWFEKIIYNTNDEFLVIRNYKYNEKFMQEVAKTPLYKNVKQRLLKIKPNENCILFIPFPLMLEFENSDMQSFIANNYHQVVKGIFYNEPELIKGKEIYAIYPNHENKIIIIKIFTGTKMTFDIEFLEKNYFHEYIKVICPMN